MLDDNSMMWFRLRERRTSLQERSRLNDTAERRKTFAAAMQQFEEQMAAAKVVTPVTRPLNLYYGLVQAGLAIAAAHEPDPWSFNKHGLKLGDLRAELEDIAVQPDGNGAFQKVASATNSSEIIGPVSIGALWSSLPDLCDSAPLGSSSKFPHALYLTVDNPPPRFTNPMHTLTQADLPYWPVSIFFEESIPDEGIRGVWLQERMQSYPCASGVSVGVNDPDIFESLSEDRFLVHVKFLKDSGWPSWTTEDLNKFFDSIAPRYRFQIARYLRPAVEKGVIVPPSPLMTWWTVLYSLSMLARYRPKKWVELLDLDKSRYAVPLQFALELALEVLPHLVIEALDQRPLILSKPMVFDFG